MNFTWSDSVSEPIARVEVRSLPSSADGPPRLAGPDEGSRAADRAGENKAGQALPGGGILASLTPRAVGTGPPIDGLRYGLTNGWTPPDVQVAAGPGHVMEMVNLLGGVWTKDGTLLSAFQLSSFFAKPSDFLTDPRLLYDAASRRWFASIALVAVNTNGSVLLAVSETSDPTLGWRIHGFKAATPCPDQPTLGIAGDKVALSANDFSSCISSGTFVGAEYWILNKADLIAGTEVHSRTYGPDHSLFSVHPVQALSSTDKQFMVSTGFNGSRVLKLFTIVGLPPDLSVSVIDLPIALTVEPPDATQLGTTHLLATDDARVAEAQWFKDRLWVSLGDACIPKDDTLPRACVRLIQVDTTTNRVVQDFDLGSAGKHYFYPSLSLDSLGDLLVVFGFSSPRDFPGIMVTAQGVEDPLESLATPRILVDGTGPEGACSSRSCRYGDYFGAAVDPSDPTLVWVAGERGTPSGWATSVGSVRVRAALNFGYTVLGGGAADQAPALTYTFQGQRQTTTLGRRLQTYLADFDTPWEVTNPLAGSSPIERWQAAQDSSGSARTSMWTSFRYHRQYKVSFDYSVLLGGTGYSPPAIRFSKVGMTSFLKAPGSDWVDAGVPYVYPDVLDGSTASERWWTPVTSGVFTSPSTSSVEYLHQYLVTLRVNPPDGRGGTVSPSSGWYNATQPLQITMEAAPGWGLQGWGGSGAGSYVGPAPSTAIRVDSPINQTATFFPGLTLTASAGGSVAFSYEGNSGSVAPGASRTIYVKPGTKVMIVATTSTFYSFAGWRGSNVGNEVNQTVTMDSPASLAADFSLNGFAIVTHPFAIVSFIALAAVGSGIAVVRARARRGRP